LFSGVSDIASLTIRIHAAKHFVYHSHAVAMALPIFNTAPQQRRLNHNLIHLVIAGCHFHALIAMETADKALATGSASMTTPTLFRNLARLTPGIALAVGCLSAGGVSAQQIAQQAWGKICSKVQETDVCNVKYDVFTSTGQLVTSVNVLQSKGKTNRRIFQVAVPSGRYIPEGIKVQIDNGKVNTLPYSLCLPDRCLAETILSEGLVQALKAGGELTLTSTNFRAKKNPVKITLKGFTAAFDGPALKRDQVQNRQKKLEEELKKKARATADKLKAAQDAAKAGN